MNDYWNDPPDDPEMPLCPSCCDGQGGEDSSMDDQGAWHLTCECCGHKWVIAAEKEPEPMAEYFAPRGCEECHCDLPEQWKYSLCKACGEKPCRHGNPRHNCDACDFESDIAFDASRNN